MNRVEYRFLQAVISHVSGDRITVGLLHWDGRTLRMGRSFGALRYAPEAERDALRRSINAKLRRAEKSWSGPSEQNQMYGLSVVFPVRAGLGATLQWSPVHAAATSDPEAHFNQLMQLANLQRPDDLGAATITNRELTSQLQMALSKLAEEAPDRVKFGNTVKRLQSYTVPVSWKNGVWHHIIPLSLDGLTEREMARRVRELVGIIQLCIPLEEIPVPVAVYPSEPIKHEMASQQARIAEDCFPDRKLRIQEAEHHDDEVEVGPIAHQIRHDVRTPH